MKEKKFVLTATEKDGQDLIDCENEGFTALELLGILEVKKSDILEQMRRPADFKRYVIDKNGRKSEIVKEKENDT